MQLVISSDTEPSGIRFVLGLPVFVAAKGEPGPPGDPGADGASAYRVAVAEGFAGSEAEWLASLQGAPGAAGASVEVLAFDFADQAGFDSAVATHADDPNVLVIRYGES